MSTIRFRGGAGSLKISALITVMSWPIALNGQDSTLRDSAGVVIANNAVPAWSQDEGWSLSERPLVLLGGPDEGHDLWQVRDFLRTPDGAYAVLTAGHHEVRLFDGDGSFLRALGRSGGGPGEFNWPMSLALAPPDTLLVLDRGAIEQFLLDGSVLESLPVRAVPNAFGPGRSARPVEVGADRAMVAVVDGPVETKREPGPFRPPQGIAYFAAPGQPPVFGGDYRGGLQELVDIGGGQSRIVMPPFARVTRFGMGPTSGARFFAADNARYEIHIFNDLASLSRIVRLERSPIQVKDEWVEAWKAGQLESTWTRGRRPELQRAWREMSVPSTLPSFHGVAFDQEGYLWVMQPVPDSRAPVSFDVFDPSGRYLGEVIAPAGVQAYPPPQIGTDYFMGLWVGGLGVEQIRVYRLERSRERPTVDARDSR